MPPSIHFIAHHDAENAVARYRCLNFIEQLRSRGWEANFSYRYAPGTISVPEQIVVLNRVFLDRPLQEFIREAKAKGKAVIYGCDDLVFSDAWAQKERAEFEDEAAVAARVYEQTLNFAKRTRAALDLTDAAVVSTHFLADQIAKLSEHGIPNAKRRTPTPQDTRHKPQDISGAEGLTPIEARVLRNTLPTEVFRISESISPQPTKNLKIGYFSGTKTHGRDFEVAAGPLAKLLKRRKDAELIIVGPVNIPLALRALRDQITPLPAVEWRKLPELLAQVQINLAPLDLAFEFNQGKSHLKWLEAAAVRVPTIASRTAELQLSIEEGVDGFTVETEEHWMNALERLADDQKLRKAMGDRAFEKVNGQYRSEIQAPETEEVFQELAQRFAKDGGLVTLRGTSVLSSLGARLRQSAGRTKSNLFGRD